MFTGNGGAVAKNSGKRKMKEVAADIGEPTHQTSLFNLHGHHSQVQQILNTAAPFKPFSFMSLLTSEDEDYLNSPVRDIINRSEEIDQIVSLHSESLRRALRGMVGYHHQPFDRVAEERAAKKLKEKEQELQVKSAQNEELERLVEHYKAESERLLARTRYLEQATRSLRAALRRANAARRYAETEHEEAESSCHDPDRVEPVRLDCKFCKKQLATVMLWPCRHVCVCTRCEVGVKFCPVCCALKTTSVEVCLPLN